MCYTFNTAVRKLYEEFQFDLVNGWILFQFKNSTNSKILTNFSNYCLKTHKLNKICLQEAHL